MERLIDWHIRTPELTGGLMGNNQYAYMKGRSTESAMHQIVARAEGTLRTRTSHVLPQIVATSPIEPNILAQFRNNILQSVHILRGNTFSELCRHGCKTISSLQDFLVNPGQKLLNIVTHGQKHDGLFYSSFVNKSELVSDIKLTKPFDIYVWISFLSGGVLLSVLLCKLLEKPWSQLGSTLIWIFAIAVGQTDEIRGSQLRKRNSDNLRIFATLMKATGRFVEVRNTDWHLVDFRSGWVSSRDRVGHVFGNFLASLHEFGIYSYWINRYQKFSDSTSVHNLREDILLKYNASLKRMRVRKDVPFSWAQVEMHFALFAIGLGAACIAQLSEHEDNPSPTDSPILMSFGYVVVPGVEGFHSMAPFAPTTPL
ncbi:hypothetical protein Fcan01_11723 [Folsomia candida]|uniref:Uncharacterized protein n=1 Tax=Folsomia candida TaxID=158441 RepID=A0A226EAJ4_FOLCA|nr:hypothetical protein Fcan01_11723 [Folsomia candida]